MIRAFIALELKDEETIENIVKLSSVLKKNQPQLKVVEPKNLHMTVKFLGKISESMAPKIFNILKEISDTLFQGKIFKYQLKGVGQFNQYSVLWIKLIGDIQFLQNIKNNVENLLNEKLEIERDKRTKFKPHLTIGRLKKNKIDYKTFNNFKKIISEKVNLDIGIFTISEVKLKRSELTPKGPIYTDLIY